MLVALFEETEGLEPLYFLPALSCSVFETLAGLSIQRIEDSGSFTELLTAIAHVVSPFSEIVWIFREEIIQDWLYHLTRADLDVDSFHHLATALASLYELGRYHLDCRDNSNLWSICAPSFVVNAIKRCEEDTKAEFLHLAKYRIMWPPSDDDFQVWLHESLKDIIMSLAASTCSGYLRGIGVKFIYVCVQCYTDTNPAIFEGILKLVPY